MKNTPRALLWLFVITLFLAVRPLILGPLHGWVSVAATLAFSTLLWVLTPVPDARPPRDAGSACCPARC